MNTQTKICQTKTRTRTSKKWTNPLEHFHLIAPDIIIANTIVNFWQTADLNPNNTINTQKKIQILKDQGWENEPIVALLSYLDTLSEDQYEKARAFKNKYFKNPNRFENPEIDNYWNAVRKFQAKNKSAGFNKPDAQTKPAPAPAENPPQACQLALAFFSDQKSPIAEAV